MRRSARGCRQSRVARGHAEGDDETITFAELAAWSSRFANWMVARGVVPGERIAIMLEPSLAFYAALFGAIKAGAVAVPLFMLFGIDGMRIRTRDCSPRLLLTAQEKADALAGMNEAEVVAVDPAFMAALREQKDRFQPNTSASDLAIFQYTSGTTRGSGQPPSAPRIAPLSC